MALQLITLGGLRASRDDVDLDWLLTRRLRAAFMVYLAVERSASRESLTAVFWPESSTENARHALRQCLYHLRRDIGEDCLDVRTQEVLATAELRPDVLEFTAALQRGDVHTAAGLYAGPFLAGVNLVDLRPWEDWVESRRTHYARAFRKACREWVDALQAAGDLQGAIAAAQRWLGPDPLDDEAQHRIIAAMIAAGERTAAIRQYEAYERLLEPEGLRPLDETTGLIERVRSAPVANEARRLSPEPAARHAGVAPIDRLPPAPSPEERRDEHGRPGAPSAPRWFQRRLPARRAIASAAALVLLILAAAWIVDRSSNGQSPTTSAEDLAVLPFSVRGEGSAQYLEEGIVGLLGAALDGASVRPVDARAVFGLVAQDGAQGLDLERAEQLATRLGAGLFVVGDVTEAGGRLQIDAAVYRTGASADPVARAIVNGGEDRVFDLVDDLAAQLLGELGQAPRDRLTRTAASTTSSLAAFKHYLKGNAEIRAGRFERAAEAYQRAIDGDSTFAIAHYRLALARDWSAQGDAARAARAAARHAQRLTPRDRALLEAFLAYNAGDAPDAERRYRAILSRYPDDLEAWFQLAEVLFHYGPARGRPTGESEQAWRNVLAYEPRNLSAIVHVARIAAADARPAGLDSLLAPFAPADLMSDRRLVQVGALRAIAHADTSALRTIVQSARGWEDAAVWQLAAYLTAFSHEPAAAAWAVQQLIEPRRAAGATADLHWFAALLHLESGQLGAARKGVAEALAAARTVPDQWERRTFALVTDWWMATLPVPWPDSAVERIRRTASSAETAQWRAEPADAPVDDAIWFALVREGLGGSARLDALRLYTVGTLSLRLAEIDDAGTASIALAKLAASESADWFVRALDQELRARRAWQEGKPEQALRILDEQELGPVPVGVTIVVPFLAHAQRRYLRGELLTALGRDAEALPWFASLGGISAPESAFRAPGHLRQAEILERLGRQDEAARHYERFLRLWRDSDPELQSWVKTVRRQQAPRTQ